MPEDKNEDFLGFLAVLFLGLVGLAIIGSIFEPRCPRCRKSVQKGIYLCPHCGAFLEWPQ